MLLALGAAGLLAGVAQAQVVTVGGYAGSYAMRESTAGNHSGGLDLGISAAWHRRRLGARIDISRAHLSPADSSRATFNVVEVDGRLSYRLSQAFDAELGVTRRTISPSFATPDIGAVSLGVRSEARLASIAGVWARGAFLPIVRFNDGGSAGTSLEFGLGTWLLVRGATRAELDCEVHRFDRSVGGVALPVQTVVTRLGVQVPL
ncbi:MAG TPA: hypothetical protein VGI92_09135 [Gemmatimonadales bacterium]|jgi:hypothetical protein